MQIISMNDRFCIWALEHHSNCVSIILVRAKSKLKTFTHNAMPILDVPISNDKSLGLEQQLISTSGCLYTNFTT